MENMSNKREQRCIELYERLKTQYVRSHVLDDADTGFVSWHFYKE